MGIRSISVLNHHEKYLDTLDFSGYKCSKMSVITFKFGRNLFSF